MSESETTRVRRYYDRNTAAFVAYGQGGAEGAIHRAVWGPGARDRRDAFHYVEDRIADVIRSRSAPSSAHGAVPHVVDLGCGVGASLCYLAERLRLRGTGITISPAQAALGRQRIRALGLDDRVVCIEGDYTNLPSGVEQADVAFAIESFVHAPDPAAFFSECARLIRPGGALVICDDLRADGGGGAAERTLRRFAKGWLANAIVTRAALTTLALNADFAPESAERLTPYLELRRPRDLAIAALVAPFTVLPRYPTRLGSLIGGTALQTSLARGWLDYELHVFRRL